MAGVAKEGVEYVGEAKGDGSQLLTVMGKTVGEKPEGEEGDKEVKRRNVDMEKQKQTRLKEMVC